jgi:hypothetical protein
MSSRPINVIEYKFVCYKVTGVYFDTHGMRKAPVVDAIAEMWFGTHHFQLVSVHVISTTRALPP